MSGDAAQDLICSTSDFAARRVWSEQKNGVGFLVPRGHSYRSARIGSILEALLAGKYPAARATASNTTAAKAMVAGSRGVTPNSMVGASGSAVSPSIAADITRVTVT